MDKQILVVSDLKMYVHDDDRIEIYDECPFCRKASQTFIPIADFSEALARARSFLAGIIRPER